MSSVELAAGTVAVDHVGTVRVYLGAEARLRKVDLGRLRLPQIPAVRDLQPVRIG